MVLSC